MAFTKVTLSGGTKDTIKAAFTKVNTLIDDMLAVTTGKGASQIGVEDSAGNFTGTNVETILAELKTVNVTAEDLVNTFNEKASTTTGLTWGYTGGTLGTATGPVTVAAGTVLLTGSQTNYVEISVAGTVSANITGFSTGSIPLRTVVCSAGAQTSSTDNRAFIGLTMAYATSTSYLTKTQAHSPYTVLASGLRGDVVHDNSGATGQCIFQLPAGAAGSIFQGEVKAAQYLQVKASGAETIRYLSTQSAAGGYIRANTIGKTVKLRWNGTEWVVLEINGSWLMDI